VEGYLGFPPFGAQISYKNTRLMNEKREYNQYRSVNIMAPPKGTINICQKRY
jgi:hypothetical protein